ncbi:hypothetical protein [Maricaulis parjimensis]|uniref:hypothetical protein n=1 Tax=Maricaulis parjimensis TaxID=144023 RepID=UPI00193AB808|nr:hypothetical protein [Maricaulis parjimensis]
MSVKRSIFVLAALAGAASLSGCVIYEGTDAVCPHGDPNSPNWPYCGSAPPGGAQPADGFPNYSEALADPSGASAVD